MIETWPVLLAGAQIRTFEHERSPAGHHEALPRQLAASPAGAAEHGAANQVRLLGESAPALGGQAEIEQGVEPNWHAAAQAPAGPAGKIVAVVDIFPGWLVSLNTRFSLPALVVPDT
jgi:hypothetical protein